MYFKFESHKAKEERLEAWHKWFAWYPVKNYSGEFFWLTTIERRRVTVFKETLLSDGVYNWEIRKITPPHPNS